MASFDSPFDDVQPGDLYRGVQTNPIHVPSLRLPDPDMNPLVPIAAGSMQHVIQEQANDSVLRQALFYTSSKNKFNNAHFDRMCRMVVELADIESRRSRLPDEELCDKAADIVGTLFAALESDADRSLERYLSSNQMRQVDDAMRTYDTLVEDIQNFYNNRGRDDRARGSGRGDSRTSRYDRDDRARGRDGGRDNSRREPVRGGRGWDGGRDDSGGGRGRTAQGSAGRGTKDRGSEEPYVHGRAGRVEKEAPKPQEPTKETKTRSTPPGRLKNLVQQTSMTMQHGYLPPNVYPLVYVLGEQVAFWVKKDDIYLNTIVSTEEAKEKNMDYKDHATDLLLVSRTADLRDATPDKESAFDAAKRLQQLERVDALLARIENQSTDPSLAIKEGAQCNLVLSGYIPPITGDDYWAPAQNRLSEIPGIYSGLEDAVVVYTVAQPYAWSVNDTKSSALMQSLYNSKNWNEMKALLICMRPPILPIYYWEMLHTAITDYVNFYVNVVLNVDVSIGSFVDDLDSLEAEIDKEQEVVKKLFDAGCREVCNAVIHCMRHEILEEITHVEWSKDVYCIVTLDNVILLPVTTTDLSLACASEIGAVTATSIPWLYKALDAVFPQLQLGARYNKLVTSDGGVYYVMQNKLYEGYIITNHCDFTP